VEFLVHHYEAFSSEPGKGNPAGVVLDGQELSDATMQEIAKRVGFNETAFVLPSKAADLRLRYFTPGHEINLCGHATVASLFALYDRGIRGLGNVTVETLAGTLPMAIRMADGNLQIEMTQAAAEFTPFDGDPATIASVLGISAAELHPSLPITFGSTGTWTLLVPVKSLQTIRKMRPDTNAFPAVMEQMSRSSIHPFCLEHEAPNADLSARHFSSPFSGTVEDPITGTASGVMGAYMATHAANWMIERNYTIVVEQGKDVGRDGRVYVSVINRRSPFRVKVGGTASYVRDLSL
jgi:PhzF family phenazine biosynthesis protein